MRRKLTILGAALVAGALAASSAQATPGNGNGNGKGRPGKGRSDLAAAAADEDAAGRVDVKHFPAVGGRAERSWLRFKLRNLTADATYTLWMDDPTTVGDTTLVEVTGVTFTATGEGGDNHRIDSKKGDTLPFGATLTDLGGLALEIRDAAGAAVLTGNVPTVQ